MHIKRPITIHDTQRSYKFQRRGAIFRESKIQRVSSTNTSFLLLARLSISDSLKMTLLEYMGMLHVMYGF